PRSDVDHLPARPRAAGGRAGEELGDFRRAGSAPAPDAREGEGGATRIGAGGAFRAGADTGWAAEPGPTAGPRGSGRLASAVLGDPFHPTSVRAWAAEERAGAGSPREGRNVCGDGRAGDRQDPADPGARAVRPSPRSSRAHWSLHRGRGSAAVLAHIGSDGFLSARLPDRPDQT